MCEGKASLFDTMFSLPIRANQSQDSQHQRTVNIAMDMRYPRTICFLCAWLTISLGSCQIPSQKIDDKRESGYTERSGIVPDNGVKSYENWTLCDYGKQQSPIDVTYSVLNQNMGSLKTSYFPSIAVMKNDGYAINVEWVNGGGSLETNGKNYTLLQCHWHSPSEHTGRGIRYPLELHMVHQSSDNEIAVIGILYETGEPDPFLTPELMQHLRRLIDYGQTEEPLGLVLAPVIPAISMYYRYPGSLTTPPCDEGVVWNLLVQLRSVSQEQLNLLRAAVHWNFNARPVQPLNGRYVSRYNPVIGEHASY